MDWTFDASNSKLHCKKAVEFIDKLSKKFIVKLTTTKDEIIAAKWLIDNNAANLIKCLVEEENNFFACLNDECMKNCKDFNELYENFAAVKD